MPIFEPGSLDELKTERLVLRRPSLHDRDDFHRMHADPKVMATLGGVTTPEVTDARLARLIAHWDAHDFGYWVVSEPGSGRFAGRGGLRQLVVEREPVIEVGYGFLSEFWGRGLATEVAAASVRAAFEGIGVDELVCFTTPSNLASRNVMEKVGFRHTGSFVHAGEEHRLCRLRAADWRKHA